MKITVIWNKTWISGGRHYHLTKCSRILRNEKSVNEQLEELGILNVQYIFDGWPKMFGEDDSDIVEGTL